MADQQFDLEKTVSDVKAAVETVAPVITDVKQTVADATVGVEAIKGLKDDLEGALAEIAALKQRLASFNSRSGHTI